nr:unnamed protein product [Callosobruchus chinensis]
MSQVNSNMLWYLGGSHICGAAAPTTLSIVVAVQRRAIRLIGDPVLTWHLQPLSHRHAVGDLLLFCRLPYQLFYPLSNGTDLARYPGRLIFVLGERERERERESGTSRDLLKFGTERQTAIYKVCIKQTYEFLLILPSPVGMPNSSFHISSAETKGDNYKDVLYIALPDDSSAREDQIRVLRNWNLRNLKHLHL